MHSKNSAKSHIIVLEKGEDLTSSILEYCSNEEIRSAWIRGLGALYRAEFAFYHLDQKKYQNKELSEPLELLILNGNVAVLDDKPILHLHAVVSNAEMATYGGHLNSATVAATTEIILEESDIDLVRAHSPEIGLNLIQKS